MHVILVKISVPIDFNPFCVQLVFCVLQSIRCILLIYRVDDRVLHMPSMSKLRSAKLYRVQSLSLLGWGAFLLRVLSQNVVIFVCASLAKVVSYECTAPVSYK